jgi:hypothetical protein
MRGHAEPLLKAKQYKDRPRSLHPFSTLLLSARQAGKLALPVAFDSSAPMPVVPEWFSTTEFGEGMGIRGPFDERGHRRND